MAAVKKPGKKRTLTKTSYNIRLKMSKKQRKNQYNPKEEARLEKIVFGDTSDIIDHLPEEKHAVISKKAKKIIERANEKSDDVDELNESDNKNKPAWIDEDDDEYSVDDALYAQNRKLPVVRPEKLYTELLQNKYRQIVGTPKWAEIDRKLDDFDDLDNEILKHSCHIEKTKLKSLSKDLIDIKALTPLNKHTRIEGPIVSSLEFHPTSTVALVAGSSGNLSIFQVDGIENNKLHTMHYKKFPISKATFLKEGDEILVGSQYYPHCHSYDLISGKNNKIPLPHNITSMKKYEVSPDGKLIALCGRQGEIYLLSSSSKELVGTLKMNAKCKALAFTPDSKTLISHGEGSEMYIWDVNNRTCMHRAIDDGCLTCSSLAISPSGQFVATGSKQGVVNIYERNTVVQNKSPAPLKIILNLVTPITALKFNPTSEILAMASDEQNNAFKMVHIPSFSVFSNFPTFQTSMATPMAIDFSPNSGYLGITNKSSSAFLYRLKHYGNY